MIVLKWKVASGREFRVPIVTMEWDIALLQFIAVAAVLSSLTELWMSAATTRRREHFLKSWQQLQDTGFVVFGERQRNKKRVPTCWPLATRKVGSQLYRNVWGFVGSEAGTVLLALEHRGCLQLFEHCSNLLHAQTA
jgi:hypothetical protein